MDSYIDVYLIPDKEMPINRLMNVIYTKLHKALYSLNSTTIGVSFPHYRVTLGNLLRIHGTRKDLEKLLQIDWVGGIDGYCKLSTINSVPDKLKFRIISRKQSTMSSAKLRRLLKRGSIPEEQTKIYQAKIFTKSLENPYVELVSGSNNQRHRRYIEFGNLLDQPTLGNFDQFGLSKAATIPWF